MNVYTHFYSMERSDKMGLLGVTLNPNDKSTSSTITNSNLTVSASAAGNSVRATHSKTIGKWYWEVKLDNNTAVSIGVANSMYSLTGDHLNTNQRGFQNGTKYPENSAYGLTPSIGDIIGVAVDLDNGTLEYYRNGSSMGISHTNLKTMGILFPFVRIGAPNASVTFNFGGKPFSYSIPNGFKMYDYTPDHKILLANGGKQISFKKIYTDNLIPIMTSNIAPSGIASASDETSTPAFRAFDGKSLSNNYWGANAKTYGWIAYDFKVPTLVARYDLTVILDNPKIPPKDWTFEGSNDGSNWTILDTQTNQSTWVNNVPNIYNINNYVYYQRYRLNATSNNGAVSLGIGEMRMYGIKYLSMDSFHYDVSEKTYIDFGMNEVENLAHPIGEIREHINTNTTLGSGKTYEHTIDMSKRQISKITLA
jgi:hypothetical protein